MEDRFNIFGIQEFTISLTRGNDTCITSPGGLRIKGAIDEKKLEKSVQKLVKESDAMRIVFEKDPQSEKLCQRVLDSYDYTLDLRQLEGSNEQEQSDSLEKDLYNVMKEVEYLPDGNVKWKCVLYRYSPEDHGLWFIMSHCLADGISISTALTRIVLRYNGMPLPPISSYIEYLKDQYALETDPDCVQDRAEIQSSLNDHKSPADFSAMGKTEGKYREIVTLDIKELKSFARSNKMSMFHCTLFMFHAAIAATFKGKDTMIGVASDARKLKHLSSIGEYLTGYPDRNIFTDDTSMKEAAVACKTRFLSESRKDYALYNCFRNGTEFVLAYQKFGDDSKEIKFGKAKAVVYEDLDRYVKPFHWAALSLDAYEAADCLALMAGLDDDVFTEEVLGRLRKAFKLANKVLSGSGDMTFGEFTAAVNED